MLCFRANAKYAAHPLSKKLRKKVVLKNIVRLGSRNEHSAPLFSLELVSRAFMEAFLSSISEDEDVSERAAECLQLWSDSMASWEASKVSTMRQARHETTVLVAIRPHMKIYEELFPGTFLIFVTPHFHSIP